MYFSFKELLQQTLHTIMHLQRNSINVLFHSEVSKSRAVLRAFFQYFKPSTVPFR